MADGRKRRGPLGLSSSSRPRRRSCTTDEEEEEEQQQQQRATVMTALTAMAIVVGVVVSGVAQAHAPQVRAPIYEPRRLDWDHHVMDLDERDGWRRSYRMDKQTFFKLVQLLRPLLQVNTYFAWVRSQNNGAIPVEVRLAVALRILAGGTYWDAALMFGLAAPTVYHILWQVIDAINATPEVGKFYFPQDAATCLCHAERFKAKSTNGIFDWVVAAVDGLFKTEAPRARSTANQFAYYSGSKSAYGINVQAMCTADYWFCATSAIAPGSTNDWVAWIRCSLAKAVNRLPEGFHIIGDAAYPISEKLFTPHPGRNLPAGEDAFNFYLSQLRVKIEQSFGILVSTWGILWKPLRVQYAGRGDLITAFFHLHNFLRDEKVAPVQIVEEDATSGCGRPTLSAIEGTLPADWQTSEPAPSRSGETPT